MPASVPGQPCGSSAAAYSGRALPVGQALQRGRWPSRQTRRTVCQDRRHSPEARQASPTPNRTVKVKLQGPSGRSKPALRQGPRALRYDSASRVLDKPAEDAATSSRDWPAYLAQLEQLLDEARLARPGHWDKAAQSSSKEAADEAEHSSTAQPVECEALLPEKASAAAVPATAEEDRQKEWVMVLGLCALVSLICSIDRAAISVALVPMSKNFHWSGSVKGAISSAFFVGYTFTNLAGGYLSTRYSAKNVLGAGVVIWSAFTMLTPLVASSGVNQLMVVRALMGMGEGVAFPSINNLFARWVPAENRSRALALAYSGGQLGNIVALVTAPMLINKFGWESTFYTYGALGLFWMLAWVPLVKAQPPALSPAEAGSGKGSITSFKDVPWRGFARNRATWALLAVHCTFGVGPIVLLSWMPTFYAQEYGADVTHSALMSGLPWAATFACSNLAGWLSDTAINKGWLSRTATRKLMQGVASLGATACLAALSLMDRDPSNINQAVALLTATLAVGGFSTGGYGSTHQDIAPRYSGILFGITNASASIAGAAGVYATGRLLDTTDSWSLVFQIVACIYAAGAVAFLAWGSAEKQFD